MEHHRHNTYMERSGEVELLLFNEYSSHISTCNTVTSTITWNHSSIDTRRANKLFTHHLEVEKRNAIRDKRAYKCFSYRSPFHAFRAVANDRSAINEWQELFARHTVLLVLDETVRHWSSAALHDSDVGICTYCESTVYVNTAEGVQLGVAMNKEHQRIHKAYGRQSVAINPVCQNCYEGIEIQD